MYRLNAPPARATSATNLVLANDLVFSVGHAPGVEPAAAAAVLLAGALFTVLLLLELHAAVKASKAITRMTDNFRTIRRPPDEPRTRITGRRSFTPPADLPATAPSTHHARGAGTSPRPAIRKPGED